MQEAYDVPYSELVTPDDAEEMLRILEKRLLEPYFDPPVESLLDFLADVGKEHFDQKLAELTDPLRRADVKDERKNLESNLSQYRERLAKAEEESREDWRKRLAVRREMFAMLLDRVLLFQVLPRIESCRAYFAAFRSDLSIRFTENCSAEGAGGHWQKAHDVEFERMKLRHSDLLRSRMGNLFHRPSS